MTPILLTLDEAAQVLRVSRRTIERRISLGALAVYSDGGRVAVPESELRRYVAERTSRTSPTRSTGPTGGRILPAGARLWD